MRGLLSRVRAAFHGSTHQGAVRAGSGGDNVGRPLRCLRSIRYIAAAEIFTSVGGQGEPSVQRVLP